LALLYPSAMGFLIVASYYSQGCGGGILTSPHGLQQPTEILNKQCFYWVARCLPFGPPRSYVHMSTRTAGVSYCRQNSRWQYKAVQDGESRVTETVGRGQFGNPGWRTSAFGSRYQRTENFKEKEKFVADPRWVPDTKTDWPIDFGRNISSTSTVHDFRSWKPVSWVQVLQWEMRQPARTRNLGDLRCWKTLLDNDEHGRLGRLSS
jgi:hypothetical protein